MTWSATKQLSFKLTKPSLTGLRAEVLDYVRLHPDKSRYQIAEGLSRRVSSICARVNELCKDGLLYVSGTVVDEHTGMTVETVRVR